ncbi:hypothetical protein BK741_26885 [Bacillus thuringiensis serovar iberica]|uniref:Uncharacterized protein n=1 Tax=Bacillus thuringiensis serovar iberica TaxID=180866 RepID=A0A9X6LFT8_BACTU|nr:hypothetical protein BK741_26885 [Bacillus thuringiensis serovar iberica]
MIHSPNFYPLEGVSYSAAILDDTKQVQSTISFCSMVHVPHEFLYLMYKGICLALIWLEKICQKTIVLGNCGLVEVSSILSTHRYKENMEKNGEHKPIVD